LHLQCHFGQDTLSLARLGAIPTGVDLSDRAIVEAEKLATQLALPARFICCNVYDLPDHLNEQFDIVFTSYGTIGWLPDLDRWAKIVQRFLKPGGQFIIVDFHPVVWMFDDDFSHVKYRYFNTDPIIETTEGSYADPEATVKLESVGWNHDFGEVLSSLLANNLEITHFQEYDYSPYNCFSHTKKIEEHKYRIKHLENKIPMVYSLTARKKS
jgi:ubiquinone/menaquinone biosynthesis C-methylase UbiE